MVKRTQTIRRQKPTNCLGVFDHFVGLALKVLNHFLVFQLDRKSDKVNKRFINQAYYLIKFGNAFIVQEIITSCVKSSYFCLTVISFCYLYKKISHPKMYLKNPRIVLELFLIFFKKKWPPCELFQISSGRKTRWRVT